MLCEIEGCGRNAHAKNLCLMHYKRALTLKRNGGVDGRGHHQNHVRGKLHYRWNKGQMVSSHGYILVRVNKDHPRANANGYAYEHDLVMEQILGRPLQNGEVVHHKNENTQDNRPDNLELKTNAEHTRHHHRGKSNLRKSMPGEKNGQSKLTSVQVAQIRDLRRQGLTQSEVASRFGVTRGQISHIELGIAWKE